jgi:hypothetical protein
MGGNAVRDDTEPIEVDIATVWTTRALYERYYPVHKSRDVMAARIEGGSMPKLALVTGLAPVVPGAAANITGTWMEPT